MSAESIQGLALTCDRDGNRRQWLRDDFGLSQETNDGGTFLRLLDDSSHSKGLNFLMRLRRGGPVVDWELCFSLDGEPRPLSVAGLDTGEETVILAARSRDSLRALSRELAISQPELSSVCLDVLGAWSGVDKTPEDTDVYADFMRMYNDFARLQREAASQTAKLRRVSAEKDRLLNVAAHDMRNPLNVISLLAQGLALRAQDRLEPDELANLSKIVETARDMGQLIRQLLDQARLRPGQPELKLQHADLTHLIATRIELLRPLAKAKRIAIKLQQASPPTTMRFDTGRIQQVIDNLIGNAIKFSPVDSTVEIHLSACGSDGLIEVCDQGPGLKQSELTEIFQPFVKGSARPTQGEESSGLGLAICKSILDAHGGKIWAENRAPQGAAIKVLLPANPVL